MDPTSIGVVGGSGLYQHAGADRPEQRHGHAPRSAGRPTRSSSARSAASGWLFCRATAVGTGSCPRRSPTSPTSTPCASSACGHPDLGLRGRQHARGHRARAPLRARPVHRPDAGAPAHLLRRRHRRPRALRRSGLRRLADALARAGEQAGAVVHGGGTYVCMEGPQFSTRAESSLYRSVGRRRHRHDQPARGQARARGRDAYATLALATDYDCWHETEEVSVEQILKIINQNVSLAQEIIRRAVTLIPAQRGCNCGSALAHAVITDVSLIPAAARDGSTFCSARYLPRTGRHDMRHR